jgi:cytochrome c oxidase cbb3-type subunit 4
MAIAQIFDDASRVMTVLSFATFIGIVWWAYVYKKPADFESAAALPFADEFMDVAPAAAAPAAPAANNTNPDHTESKHV